MPKQYSVENLAAITGISNLQELIGERCSINLAIAPDHQQSETPGHQSRLEFCMDLDRPEYFNLDMKRPEYFDISHRARETGWYATFHMESPVSVALVALGGQTFKTLRQWDQIEKDLKTGETRFSRHDTWKALMSASIDLGAAFCGDETTPGQQRFLDEKRAQSLIAPMTEDDKEDMEVAFIPLSREFPLTEAAEEAFVTGMGTALKNVDMLATLAAATNLYARDVGRSTNLCRKFLRRPAVA